MNYEKLLEMKPVHVQYGYWAFIGIMKAVQSPSGRNWSVSEKISLYDAQDWFDTTKLEEDKKIEVKYYIRECPEKYGLDVGILFFENKPIAWFSCSGKWG